MIVNRLSNIKIISIFGATASLLFVPFTTFAQTCSNIAQPLTGGLVPCTGNGCGVCEVVVLANNVTDIIITLSLGIAVIIFMYAGWLMISSGGAAAQFKRGKEVMSNVLIGLIIILTAWLIIDIMLKTLLPNGGEVTMGSYSMPWNQIDSSACTSQAQVCDAAQQAPDGFNWQDDTSGGCTPPLVLGSSGNCIIPADIGDTGGAGDTGGTGDAGGCTPPLVLGSGGNCIIPDDIGSTGGTGGTLTINPNITYTINDPANPSLGIMTAAANDGHEITILDLTIGYQISIRDEVTGQVGTVGCSLISPPIPECP